MDKQTSLQNQAYKAIRQKIIYADYEPGKKVSEKMLEDTLMIGRTPIREALILLRHQGLVDTIPQSGNYISLIDESAVKNARFLRENLERTIMSECCAKMTPTNQKILETVIEQQELAIKNQQARDFFYTDNLFHQVCFELSGHGQLWSWLEDHNTHLERFRWLRVTVNGLKWETIMEHHYKLFQALIHKEPEEASFITSLHLHLMLEDQETVTNAYPDYFISSK